MKKSIVSIALFAFLLTAAGLFAQTPTSLKTEIIDLNEAQYSTQSFQ
jgi:hypothetical protein